MSVMPAAISADCSLFCLSDVNMYLLDMIRVADVSAVRRLLVARPLVSLTPALWPSFLLLKSASMRSATGSRASDASLSLIAVSQTKC